MVAPAGTIASNAGSSRSIRLAAIVPMLGAELATGARVVVTGTPV
jgi:hypothetical protein